MLQGAVLHYITNTHSTVDTLPIYTLPLINLEATVCRLAITRYDTVIITSVYLSSNKKLLRRDLKSLFSLGDTVILFGDFNSKNVEWKCIAINKNGRKLSSFADKVEFNILSPLTPTRFSGNNQHRPYILHIALVKGVALRLGSIETLQRLNSDRPNPIKTITNWKRMSVTVEKTDIPALSYISNDIVSTDEIDHAIWVLITHVKTVVKNKSRQVPANKDHRKFPRDVLIPLRAKNAALRGASAYLTPFNRSRARALHRKVKARIQEVRNDNWSTLIKEITPIHKAYWKLAKALTSEGFEPTPALKKPDNTVAFDDRGKVEWLADSIEQQCSNTSSHTTYNTYTGPRRKFDRKSPSTRRTIWIPSHWMKSNPTSKKLNIRKTPDLDSISNKLIKCFSLPLMALLVAIFNACRKNCYFPSSWKEAIIIGIPKLRKPRDLPSSYKPISLLSSTNKP
ncbi:RNA-directed DNA polymerase from mobile element jockey [Eumeta japonica]|uniref:RNA-directed DNA polymerase from mobile element jockey n=1 Tax=Eumeta variegata TaxID=151549 RepID=A0A4C1XFZ6_EUMVA|nr:RNA-directed DNA polymerase from mobile element jockey [Eumeta japonica]